MTGDVRGDISAHSVRCEVETDFPADMEKTKKKIVQVDVDAEFKPRFGKGQHFYVNVDIESEFSLSDADDDLGTRVTFKPPEPLAFWKLEETILGVAVDEMGLHDGTWSEVGDKTTRVLTDDAVDTFMGNRVNVDGTALDNLGELTVTFWWLPKNTSNGWNYGGVIGKPLTFQGILDSFALYTFSDPFLDVADVEFYADGGKPLFSVDLSQDVGFFDTWHFVVAVCDTVEQDNQKIWIDGVDRTSGTSQTITTVANTAYDVHLLDIMESDGVTSSGSFGSGSGDSIDDIKLYNIALSENEVSELPELNP